jgi:hypothetical protein
MYIMPLTVRLKAEGLSDSMDRGTVRGRVAKARLLVPSLHNWEVADALRSLVTRDEIDEGSAHEILGLHLAVALAPDVPLVMTERTTKRWVTKLGRRVEAVR